MELSAPEFLEKSLKISILDVRSPAEFSQGHIPGATNLPLLNNEERAKVGTIYKKTGKEQAVQLGYEIVNPKIPQLFQAAQAKVIDNEVLVHCWRGGMRSGNVAAFLQKQGIRAYTLKKGYKAYRQYIRDFFSQPVKLYVLGGETGSGKTEILRHLKEMGEQVIDMEALAHHKGSSFGALGELPQPTSEQFENDLFLEWAGLERTRRFWLEDESHTIGKVYISEVVWQHMKTAPIIRVKVPLEERIKRLVEDYGHFSKQEIAAAVERITRRLGPQHAKRALQEVEAGNAAEVARITLTYYDKAYDHNHLKRAYQNVHFVNCEGADAMENAKRVLEFVGKKNIL